MLQFLEQPLSKRLNTKPVLIEVRDLEAVKTLIEQVWKVYVLCLLFVYSGWLFKNAQFVVNGVWDKLLWHHLQ